MTRRSLEQTTHPSRPIRKKITTLTTTMETQIYSHKPNLAHASTTQARDRPTHQQSAVWGWGVGAITTGIRIQENGMIGGWLANEVLWVRGERVQEAGSERAGRRVGNDLSIDTTLVNSTTWRDVCISERKGERNTRTSSNN